MKLHEIKHIPDPSDYRPGDEDNPRSPHYEEMVVGMEDETVNIRDYEIYDEDANSLGTADITVVASGEFNLRAPKAGWEITDIKIAEVKMNGGTYSEEAFKKKFGDAIDMDIIKDDVKSDFDKNYDPTKNDD